MSSSGWQRAGGDVGVLAGVWVVGGGVGNTGAYERAVGRAKGDDHESAAPPSMVGSVVTTPVAMLTSALRSLSRHMAQRQNWITSPCAKIKTLPLSSYNSLLVCNFV